MRGTALKETNQAGFTLIELMVTVAIIGILAALAIPSYRHTIDRSHRGEAKAALLDDAQFLERNFTEANAYNVDSAGTAIAIPVITAPREGTASYNITAVTTATTYILTATPIVGGRMAADGCGNFELTNYGQKTVTGALGAATCWNR